MEQNDLEKTSEGTPKSVLNDEVRPNHNTPPITRAQYPNKHATANAILLQGIEDTGSNDEDGDNQRRIMSSLQAFCTDRFIKSLGRCIPELQ